MMEYKGYIAETVVDEEAGVIHGEVINTRDVITFQSDGVKGLRRAFRDSVEDYLEFCKERGEEPDRPFSGRFVVRISPDLHRKIFIRSRKARMSLNAFVAARLAELGREG